jgi:hypothetical protein
MPSYRFLVRVDNLQEDDLGDLYSFIDWESKSGDWDANGPGAPGEQWFGARFERKNEAVYFKTRFNAKIVEWDESGIEPRTAEELLAEGYVHVALRVPRGQGWPFTQWCEERNFGVVEEIKFIGETEPFNVYAPNQTLADEAVNKWAVPATS